MKNIIVVAIILLMLFLAIRYMYKARKKGKCIGCPYAKNCNNSCKTKKP